MIVSASAPYSVTLKKVLRFTPVFTKVDLGRSAAIPMSVKGISAGNIFRLRIMSPSNRAIMLLCPPHAKHSHPVSFLVRHGSVKSSSVRLDSFSVILEIKRKVIVVSRFYYSSNKAQVYNPH